MPNANNGWNEYSKLVLEQLEALSIGIDGLRDEVQDLKRDLAVIQAGEDKVTELKAWKGRFDDVASPTQLKKYLVTIDELTLFKTKAITIFTVVQFAMVIILGMLKIS